MYRKIKYGLIFLLPHNYLSSHASCFCVYLLCGYYFNLEHLMFREINYTLIGFSQLSRHLYSIYHQFMPVWYICNTLDMIHLKTITQTSPKEAIFNLDLKENDKERNIRKSRLKAMHSIGIRVKRSPANMFPAIKSPKVTESAKKSPAKSFRP